METFFENNPGVPDLSAGVDETWLVQGGLEEEAEDEDEDGDDYTTWDLDLGGIEPLGHKAPQKGLPFFLKRGDPFW